jgi:hypothetical protein
MRRTRKIRKRPAILVEIINRDYQEILRGRTDPTKHVFFQSLARWKQQYAMLSQERQLPKLSARYSYDPTTDLSDVTPLKDCKFVPNKLLTRAYLDKFYEQLLTQRNYEKIRTSCIEMSEYNLPATVTSLSSWKQHSDPTAINVLILGAGPVGLFTALYLNEQYNKKLTFRDVSMRKINFLLVDNRIKSEGVKLPYSRSTQFAFNISEIQPFLKSIFCWNTDVTPEDTRVFDNILVLENLLYCAAFHESIPMAFTKKFDEYESIKQFIQKESIHVVFDCTGGRSKIPVTRTLRWNQYSLKEGNQEIKLNKDTQYYEMCEDGVTHKKLAYRLQLFDKQNKEFLVGNKFAFPTDAEDIEHANKYNNMCFSAEDYIRLSRHFKADTMRELFPYLVKVTGKTVRDIKTVKISSFNSFARHSPFAAAPLLPGCTLIRVGDSLGNSDYGILFGMKHSIEFSRHICNLLTSFL